MKGGAISRTHTSVSARPEQKMSRAELHGRLEWMEGMLLFVKYAPSTAQRKVFKKSANAKRRRRDKEMIDE